MGQQAAVLGLVLLAATGLVAHAQNLELPKLPYDYGVARPAARRETLLANNVLVNFAEDSQRNRRGAAGCCSAIVVFVGAACSSEDGTGVTDE